MIQGFGFQVNNFMSNQNKVNLTNNQTTSKNNFNDILDNKSKSRKAVDSDKNKAKNNNDQIIKQQNSQMTNRRVDVKSEQAESKPKEQSQQSNVKQEEVIVSKKEKTIEELIENLSEILAVFQNIVGINTNDLEEVNLEDLNSEISLEELENLKLSLENIIDTFDLGDSEQEIRDAIANIGKMIQDVNDNGEMEVSAEKFMSQLKVAIDLISLHTNEDAKNTISSDVKDPSNQLQDLIDTMGNSKNLKQENEPSENKLDQPNALDSKTLENQATDNLDIKIKIVTEKKEGINLFDILGDFEELNVNTIEEIDSSIEQMPINILSNNSDGVKAENLTKTVNNAALNPEQFMDIDKLDVLKQITSKVKADYENELNEIKIKLNPQHLGELTIKVSLERGVLSARAFVENTNIKQLLESNIDELKSSLKEQGVEFGSIDVSVGSDSNSEEKNPNFFMNHKRVNGLKTKIENPVDTNYQTSSMTAGEGGVDIKV